MTREEAIQYWKPRYEHITKFLEETREEPSIREYAEAIDMAIEALTSQNLTKPNNDLISRAETPTDLISREDAIEAVCGDCTIENRESCKRDGYCYEVRNLMALPSADRPKGEWVHLMSYKDGSFVGYECDQCHTIISEKTTFCPNCGADMRGGEHE